MVRMAQGNRQYDQERRLVNNANEIEWADRYYGHVLQETEQQARRVVRCAEAPRQTDSELVDDLMGRLVEVIKGVKK